MIFSWLKSFYLRRIAVPIGPDALMLDVGCGDKPHWRADVLVDKFLDARHAKQRNRGGDVTAIEPLFEAPLEDLPFRDDAFDFAYCSHVLEHVADPVRAISELVRVAKTGYIEVPFVGIQKVYDQETHLWFCDCQDGVLTFTAKHEAVFDADIERFLRKGPLKPIAFAMNFYPDAAMIRATWKPGTTLAVKATGVPNLSLSEPAEADEADNLRPPRLRPWQTIRNILRWLFRSKLRRSVVTFNTIVKPEYALPADESLSRKIYHMSGARAK